jgi:hypothetical protein
MSTLIQNCSEALINRIHAANIHLLDVLNIDCLHDTLYECCSHAYVASSHYDGGSSEQDAFEEGFAYAELLIESNTCSLRVPLKDKCITVVFYFTLELNEDGSWQTEKDVEELLMREYLAINPIKDRNEMLTSPCEFIRNMGKLKA